jgi:hypothetical protein
MLRIWFVVFGGGLSLIFSFVSSGVILFYKILQDTWPDEAGEKKK